MTKLKRRILKSFIALIIALVVIVTIWVVLYFISFENEDFELGVNFSKEYSEHLGLDWQETYLAILDDLKVKNLRLAAPWKRIEPNNDQFDFQDLDWQVTEATKRGADIILIVGRRTPHWPECHDPVWLAGLTEEEIRAQQLAMVERVVNHYKNYDQIKIWQIENEPLLDYFGDCPASDINFLQEEIKLVKSLDERPILITDSGELSLWLAASNVGDIFGTTLYRVTFNPLLGYAYYHLPPSFYRLKSWLVGQNPEEVIVSELQAEPWSFGSPWDVVLEEQLVSMDENRLINHVRYAQRIGFKGAYLWGAEWWYWLKEKKNYAGLWTTAKHLFE